MARRNRVELLLPVELIQEIQSRLTRREGSVSACLSKSWNKAWLSRTNPVFDVRDFRVNGEVDTTMFREYFEKIIQGHEEVGYKIKSCRIYINNIPTARELILKAMELGAINIEFETRTSALKLFPQEVLESENLVELSVTGCRIHGKANLSSLKSLRLCKVRIEDDHMISDILSSCPLIEKMVFSSCNFFVHLQSPNLATSSTNKSLSKYLVFHYLKYLILEDMVVSREFYDDFLSKFPCLKGLDVRHCTEFTDPLLIHSPTLESIHFTRKVTLKARFHVPNIRKFSFVGTKVPCLIFEGAKGKWESDLSITWQSFRTSWFLKLNGLLRHLSLQSKITSLSLVLGSMRVEKECFRFPRNVGLPKPVVESLKIRVDSPMSCGVMDALFWSFHPKLISLTMEEKYGFHELLLITLIQEVNENGCIPNRNGRALDHLQGVDLEIFDDTLGEFQPLTWKMMDNSVSPETQLRLKLQWGMP